MWGTFLRQLHIIYSGTGPLLGTPLPMNNLTKGFASIFQYFLECEGDGGCLKIFVFFFHSYQHINMQFPHQESPNSLYSKFCFKHFKHKQTWEAISMQVIVKVTNGTWQILKQTFLEEHKSHILQEKHRVCLCTVRQNCVRVSHYINCVFRHRNVSK